MDATLMAKQIQLRQWAKDYQDFLDSGLSQRKWCEERGINQTTFGYRYRRLRQLSLDLKEKEENVNLPVTFAKVPQTFTDAASSQDDSAALLHISYDGKQIEISKDIPPEYFKLLVEVIFNAK